jgi:hypothetical protein
MKRNTFQEIDGFITAGMCLNAPVYSLSFYP